MARNRKPAHLLTGHTNSKSHMEACAKLEAEMINKTLKENNSEKIKEWEKWNSWIKEIKEKMS